MEENDFAFAVLDPGLLGEAAVLLEQDPRLPFPVISYNLKAFVSYAAGLFELLIQIFPAFLRDFSEEWEQTLSLLLEVFSSSTRPEAVKKLKSIGVFWEAFGRGAENVKEVKIFCGRLRYAIRRRLRTGSLLKRTRIAASFGQLKRAAEKVPDEFIAESLLKHAKTLSTPAPDLSPEIITEIQQNVRRILQGFSFGRRHLYRPHEASQSACYERTRGEGGARSFLKETFGQSSRLQGSDVSFHGNRELYEMIEGPAVVVDSDRPELVSLDEDSKSPSPVYKMAHGTAQFDVRPVESNYFDPFHMSEIRHHINSSATEPAHWQVVPVTEPLKVRVITKGPAIAQFVGKGLQQRLHDFLGQLPPFILTTRPCSPEVIQDLIKDMWKDVWWVSGDYSAATDGINLNVTKAIFEEVLLCQDDWDHLTSKEEDLLRSLLYESTLEYGPIVQDNQLRDVEEIMGIEAVVQRNGQLMGSILSFPILCLANYVCLKMALDRIDPKVSDWTLKHCLINGDDIVFPAGFDGEAQSVYKRWSSFLQVFGFNKSEGKNFLQKGVLTINTETYITSDFTVKRAEYYPVGLLLGKHKVTGRLESRMLPFSDVLSLVLSGSFDPVRAWHRFCFFNRATIFEATKAGLVNIFLPIPMGGLGVRPPAEFWQDTSQQFVPTPKEFFVTKLQTRVALELLMSMRSMRTKFADYKKFTVKDSCKDEGLQGDPWHVPERRPRYVFLHLRDELDVYAKNLSTPDEIRPPLTTELDTRSVQVSRYTGASLFFQSLKGKLRHLSRKGAIRGSGPDGDSDALVPDELFSFGSDRECLAALHRLIWEDILVLVMGSYYQLPKSPDDVLRDGELSRVPMYGTWRKA